MQWISPPPRPPRLRVTASESNIEQGISNSEVEKPSNLELKSVLERFFTSLLDIPCSILDIRFHVFDGSFSPQIQYG